MDEVIWLKTRYGHLNMKAPICWEQTDHTKDNQPSNTHKFWWIPPENCQYTITLRTSSWFGTDWLRQSGIYWAASNGT